MTTYDHAQQIFSAMLGTRGTADRPFPSGDALPNLAKTAMHFAKVFAEANKDEPKQ